MTFMKHDKETFGSLVRKNVELFINNVDKPDDLGFFDYIEDFQADIAKATSTFVIIGMATDKLALKFANHRGGAEEIVRNGDGISFKSLINSAALDMDEFADELKSELVTLSASRSKAFGALANALTIYGEFSAKNSTELEDLKVQLATFASNALQSANPIVSFRSTVAALPRLTKEINRAKRGLCEILDSLVGELRAIVESANNIIESIEKMKA